MNHKRAIAFCVALLAASAVHPTTLARLSLPVLAHASPVIVRVRCRESAARWESGEIWTFTDFTVLETWKGQAPERITIRLIGGRVGPVRSYVDGVPRFAAGQQAVLFLAPAETGSWVITAWGEGTFRIAHDPASGTLLVTQESAGGEVFDPARRRFRRDGIRLMPLAEFRARVEAAGSSTQ